MEQDTFLTLADQYKDTVFRVALNYMGNTYDADDIVQDVFLKLYTRNKHFESDNHARFCSQEELTRKAGNGNFLGTANYTAGAYMYEDGTFHYDGTASFDGLIIDYQFMNCKKGAFTDVILNIGNLGDYREWSYQTDSGITVRLAMSPYKSLVIADMEESFVTINVLAGTDYGFLDEAGKITAFDLELFANSFDYTLLK